MKIDDRFSPTIAAIGRPSKFNFLTVLGTSAADYTKMREDDEIKDIKIDEIKKKVRDDKKFAALQSYDGGLGAFTREHGVFETSAGASAAEDLFKGRAAQRIAEGKYGLAVRKANRPRAGKRKTSNTFVPTSGLDAYNTTVAGAPAAKPQPVAKTIVGRGKEKGTGRTVVKYSDGSVAYAE